MSGSSAAKRAGVVIVDYGSGNLRSAAKAFERAARETQGGHDIRVTADPGAVASAGRIVLPGVGAFGDCKAGIAAVPGLADALVAAVRGQGVPFLGICVGMQLMAAHGHEHGVHDGFGWIAGDVVPLAPAAPELKIPHMGWNTLDIARAHPLLEGIESGAHAYFVHSYHLRADDRRDIVATADYGGPVSALVARANMAGTQFHPEKSQDVGLRLIANFLRWTP